MTIYLIGLSIFLATHIYSALRSREPGRDLRARLGYGLYMGLYSFLALGSFIVMIYGYGQMGPEPVLYTPPSWGRHLNWMLMYIAMICLAAYMFPAGHIKKTLKHPMTLSVKFWALGHLFANGDLREVLLFGSFLIYAIISRIAAKRRGDVGAANAAAQVKWDVADILVGTGLYFIFILFLHQAWFGIATGLPI